MPKSGFAFEGRGPVDRVTTFTSKSGNDIVTVVVALGGQYPQLVPVKFFGKLAAIAAKVKRDDAVEITGRLGGRDWHGKIYGDIIGESIVVAGATEEAPESSPADDGGGDDLPF